MNEQLRGVEAPLTVARRTELREAFRALVAHTRDAGGMRTDIDIDVATTLLGEMAYAIARSDAASRQLADGFVTVVMDGLRPQS